MEVYMSHDKQKVEKCRTELVNICESYSKQDTVIILAAMSDVFLSLVYNYSGEDICKTRNAIMNTLHLFEKEVGK